MSRSINMIRGGRSRENGWLPLPFEVVRRKGLFTVRATGLAMVYPEAFERTSTGDYFKVRGYGYNEPHQAAIAFAAFLRGVGCVGSNQLLSIGKQNGNGVQDWVFWGRPQQQGSR